MACDVLAVDRRLDGLRYSSSPNSWVTTTSSGRRPAARTSSARSTECRSGPPANPGAGPASTVWSMEPTSAASLYQIGRQVDLADTRRAEQEHGAPVRHGAQRLGDRLGRTDRLDDVGEAAHQHLTSVLRRPPARPTRPASSSKCAVVGVAEHDVVRAAAPRRPRPGGGDGPARSPGRSGRDPCSAASGASPMMPAPTTRTGSPSCGRGPHAGRDRRSRRARTGWRPGRARRRGAGGAWSRAPAPGRPIRRRDPG